ncbi:MAG: phosphoadenosine phosphosulfate reductase family protein [Treponema sp.]|jgi:phosphoadenosine phosphosulfate reductase|nr:phosphoadenosine phosphosulfate reductase family protein [Treponema sp.]
MLIEETLFGEQNKVEISLTRIKEFEPMALQNNPAGYYVCISGGKDSSVIQELCIMAKVKREFVHNHTSVDHPETVYFIRKEKKRLEDLGHNFRIEIPRFQDGRQKTMWNLIPQKGLPTRIVRWCCQELKEYGGEGRYCITGVRWEESARRKKGRALHEISGKTKDKNIILNNDNDMKRRLTESCIPQKKFVLNPIIDWTEQDVWDFIKKYKLPYNPLYDIGYKRVGCVGCPLSSKNHKKELGFLPKYKAAYFRAAKRLVERRSADLPEKVNTPEKYFEWWLGG